MGWQSVKAAPESGRCSMHLQVEEFALPASRLRLPWSGSRVCRTWRPPQTRGPRPSSRVRPTTGAAPLGSGRRVLGDRRRPLPESGQLQGGVPLSQRKHQAGSARRSAHPVSAGEARTQLGRRAASGGWTDGPGRQNAGRLPTPRCGRRPTSRRSPGRFGRRPDGDAAPARGRTPATRRHPAVPPRPCRVLRGRLREDRLLSNRDRPRLPGRCRGRFVHAGGPDRRPLAHQVLEGRGLLRRHLP